MLGELGGEISRLSRERASQGLVGFAPLVFPDLQGTAVLARREEEGKGERANGSLGDPAASRETMEPHRQLTFGLSSLFVAQTVIPVERRMDHGQGPLQQVIDFGVSGPIHCLEMELA